MFLKYFACECPACDVDHAIERSYRHFEARNGIAVAQVSFDESTTPHRTGGLSSINAPDIEAPLPEGGRNLGADIATDPRDQGSTGNFVNFVRHADSLTLRAPGAGTLRTRVSHIPVRLTLRLWKFIFHMPNIMECTAMPQCDQHATREAACLNPPSFGHSWPWPRRSASRGPPSAWAWRSRRSASMSGSWKPRPGGP